MKPKLRFKGFDDDWLTTNIENVLSIGNGRDYKHLDEGAIPVFGTGGLMTYVNEFLHDGETVFIGRKGTIDKPAYYNGKFWTVDTLFYTHNFIGALPLYIYGIFQNINWLSHNAASGVPSLSKDTIQKIPVIISQNLKEQKAIGEYFRKLDGLIRDTGKEIEKLENLKQASLQKMFPQSGESVPQLRFKGFYKPWQEKKIGQILTLERGLTFSPQDLTNKNEGVLVLRSSNIIENSLRINTEEEIYVKKESVNIPFINNGDILFTASNGSSHLVGKHCLIESLTNIAVHGGFMLVGKSDFPYFTQAWLSAPWYLQSLATFVTGGNGALGNFQAKEFLNKIVYFPTSAEEQKAIGGYFRNLDNMISAKKKKLEKLRQVKSSCLNLMFV